MKLKPTHLMVLGTTGTGKTTYTNELHRTFPRVSLFIDTKGGTEFWGVRIRRLDELQRHLFAGRDKLIWDPPRRADGIDWESADAQLLNLWGTVQRIGQKAKWSHDRPPWIQLIVDEAQRWEGMYTGADLKQRRHPRTLQDMAAVGLGLGLRLVYVTQYPANLDTDTRDNLRTRVVFDLEDEGRRCIQSWNWPVDDILPHVSKKHHFVTKDPVRGWVRHPPRPHP